MRLENLPEIELTPKQLEYIHQYYGLTCKIVSSWLNGVSNVVARDKAYDLAIDRLIFAATNFDEERANGKTDSFIRYLRGLLRLTGKDFCRWLYHPENKMVEYHPDIYGIPEISEPSEVIHIDTLEHMIRQLPHCIDRKIARLLFIEQKTRDEAMQILDCGKTWLSVRYTNIVNNQKFAEAGFTEKGLERYAKSLSMRCA